MKCINKCSAVKLSIGLNCSISIQSALLNNLRVDVTVYVVESLCVYECCLKMEN